MKYTLYAAVLAACALNLSACGEKKAETPPAPAAKPAPAPEPTPVPAPEPTPAPDTSK